MKISEFVIRQEWIYPGYLKLVKKWIFYIVINEDAYFMAKYFNMKITKLDNNSIKVWFPIWAKKKWLDLFKIKNISYVIFEKIGIDYTLVDKIDWIRYRDFFILNIEDYKLTFDRILQNDKIWLEEKNERNFLLQDKIEEFYKLFLDYIIRLPAKERYFLREKIENLILNIFELIVLYKYNLEDRKELISKIFKDLMLMREYLRFLYKIWKIKKDWLFLDFGWRMVEMLKIVKWVKNKLING